jgi:Tfp pilus assembly protein PilX
MARHVDRERGSVMVVAVVSMGLMLAIGLATLSFGGGQRNLAAAERVRESSFNLAEGVLNSQIFLLSRTWPAAAATAFPASCSSGATATNCPAPATVSAQFSESQYTGATWTSAVKDNGGSVATYYTTAGAASQPAYDANGDGRLWVQARGVVRGVPRTVVTQVQAQITTLPFPKNSLTGGWTAATNSGKKVLIDTSGRSYTSTPGQPGSIAVRCSSAPPSSCINYDMSKGQISPPSYQTSFSSAALLSEAQVDQMRVTAKAYGTYYSGCPSSLTGAMVFIESGSCSYGNGTFNSLASPGVVAIATGTLTLNNNAIYYGLIYGRNGQGTTGAVITIGGCAKVIGSVAVEGAGGTNVGDCGNNLAYNSAATTAARAYGDPAVVRTTWREI